MIFATIRSLSLIQVRDDNFMRDGFGDVIREISPDRGRPPIIMTQQVIASPRSMVGASASISSGMRWAGSLRKRPPGARLPRSPPTNTIPPRLSGSYGVGRLSKVLWTAAGTTRKFKYDHRGNMLTSSRRSGPRPRLDLQYGYDLGDRITSITYPSGSWSVTRAIQGPGNSRQDQADRDRSRHARLRHHL